MTDITPQASEAASGSAPDPQRAAAAIAPESAPPAAPADAPCRDKHAAAKRRKRRLLVILALTLVLGGCTIGALYAYAAVSRQNLIDAFDGLRLGSTEAEARAQLPDPLASLRVGASVRILVFTPALNGLGGYGPANVLLTFDATGRLEQKKLTFPPRLTKPEHFE